MYVTCVCVFVCVCVCVCVITPSSDNQDSPATCTGHQLLLNHVIIIFVHKFIMASFGYHGDSQLSLPSFQGEDLGPLELKIEGLQKQISDSVDQCSQMQQFWLRQQNELVKKTKSSDEQTQSVNTLKKQLLILEQKKIRTDSKKAGSLDNILCIYGTEWYSQLKIL